MLPTAAHTQDRCDPSCLTVSHSQFFIAANSGTLGISPGFPCVRLPPFSNHKNGKTLWVCFLFCSLLCPSLFFGAENFFYFCLVFSKPLFFFFSPPRKVFGGRAVFFLT